MPTYPLKCNACGTQWDQFAKVAERDAIRCACGAEPEVRFTDLNIGTPREWRGMESTSFSMPRFGDGIKADCPSAITNARGQMVFKSDAHQRQVYREMAAATKRIDERKATRAEAAKRGVEPHHALPKSLNTPAKGITSA